MFGPAVVAALALISQIMPYVSAGTAAFGTIKNIITILESLIPALYHTAKDLLPTVKNIISSLRGSDNITNEDLDRLDAIEAVIDAKFEEVAAKALAEDAAAAAAAPLPGTT